MQYKADRSTLEGSTTPKYRKSKNSVIFRDPKHIRVLQKKNLKFLSRKKKVVEKIFFFSIRILIRKRFLIVPRNTFFSLSLFFFFFLEKVKNIKDFRKHMTIHSELGNLKRILFCIKCSLETFLEPQLGGSSG